MESKTLNTRINTLENQLNSSHSFLEANVTAFRNLSREGNLDIPLLFGVVKSIEEVQEEIMGYNKQLEFLKQVKKEISVDSRLKV